MPLPKNRGRVVRIRTKTLPGGKRLLIHVMSKRGPQGGRTIATRARAPVRKRSKR